MQLNWKEVSVAVNETQGIHVVERVRRGFVGLVLFELTVNKNLKEGKMQGMTRRASLVSCQ